MKWIEAKVIFDSDEIEIAKDKITNVFYDFGVQGVQVEEPMTKDPLDFYSDDKMTFFKDYSVSGYFIDNEYLEAKKKVFIESLEKVASQFEIVYEVIYNITDEKDWENSWKKYFNPKKVSDRILVKPTWKDYEKQGDEIIIEIDPGMAFGTGTHPTTFLCINLIEKYIKPTDRLLDVGTGSGILMIAGDKLGASEVWGVDIDDMAVQVARDNLNLNNVSENKSKLFVGDLIKVIEEEKFEIVVSNILAEIVVILLEDIKKVLKKDGKIILSGIINEKVDMVKEKMLELGFEIIEILQKEEWIAIVGR